MPYTLQQKEKDYVALSKFISVLKPFTVYRLIYVAL